MEIHKKLGITKKLFDEIVNIISKYKVDRAVVFGSRALGTFRPNSDIDIAIYGSNLTSEQFNLLIDELNQLNTALDFDVLNADIIEKKEVLENIRKKGLLIYARNQTR